MMLAVQPAVVARGDHTMVVKSDGAVVGWGRDGDGQLATGRSLYSSTPRVVRDLPPMQAVSAYSEHILALDTQGRVWAWGSNKFGQLGRRVQRNAALSGRVQGISDVVAITTTNDFSAALKRDGTVWIWGGFSFPITIDPTQVKGLADVVQIAGGQKHVLARKKDGTVAAFGSNVVGELGNGNFVSSMTPTLVKGVANAVDIAGDSNGSLAVTADGKVWGWGRFSSDVNAPANPVPRQYTGFPGRVIRVSGSNGGFALMEDGTVWSFNDDVAPRKVDGFAGIADFDVGFNSMIGITSSKALVVLTGNRFGQAGSGNTTPFATTPAVVPIGAVSQAAVGLDVVVAVTTDGKLWVWGRDIEGSLGLGSKILYSSPITIAGLPPIAKLAPSLAGNVALDVNGNVWAWGSDDQSASPHSTPTQIPITDVVDVAAGWGNFLFLKKDGAVWAASFYSSSAPARIDGLPPISRIAAGWNAAYFVDASGRAYAMGDNSSGQLGDGTLQFRASPVPITSIPEPVVQVAADFRLALALTSSGKVYAWGSLVAFSFSTDHANDSNVSTPRLLSTLSNVVELAVAQSHYLARTSDGHVLSWGTASLAGRDGPSFPPAQVADLDSVISIAANFQGSYAMRADGTVWGWGPNTLTNSLVGDGTFVARPRPVLVLREDGAGSLDRNDWFVDAKPGTPKTIPAAKVPKAISTTQSFSGDAVLNVDATIRVNTSDQSKTVGLYVLGLVPAAFLKQVPTAPGTHALAANAKADTPILVNLTSAGWSIVAGQISAVTTGVNNAAIAAAGVLTNVNPATIPGARFCIGYGESASDMLRAETIRDFLSLEGATASAVGLPCLLSGVYIDGPPTSQKGTAVSLRGVVVGQSPTGSVWFRDRFSDVSAPLALSARNAAVADVSMSYTPPAAGDYAFLARYGGDSLNAAATAEIALRHVVSPVQTQQTTTRIDAAVSSEIGSEVRLAAVVAGNRPTGMVQFKRGGVNEGTPIPVINDQAVATVVGLGLGDHSFTANYSGDSSNQSSISAAHNHKVLNVASSAVSLGASANPSALGDAITLSATVTGANPTGTLQLREGVTPIGDAAALVGGKASFALPSLTAGIHVFTADYSGDSTNPKATSNPVFQQVNLNLSPTGDLDGDGVPNSVEGQEGLMPDRKDNDVFASPRLFAMQQYRDFLGREGDPPGIAFWTTQLTSNAQTRSQMIEAYFKSPEFQGTAAPVVRLYFAYFLRIPDYEGLAYWISQYRSGSSLQSISGAFVQSPEFASRYGALDNGQFVALVYRNVLGRNADGPGLAYWKGQLDTGAMTRGQVMAQFSESPEYVGLSTNSVYVTMMYAGMLRRSPDTSGFAFWVDYLDKGSSGLALINGFLSAPEYRARFL